MNAVLAQLEKDFLRTRWMLAFWAFGLIVSLASYFRADPAGPWFLFPIELLVMLVVGGLIVQDPAADPDAHWRTQPIAWWQLLMAKAVLLIAVVVLPILVVQGLGHFRLGVSGPSLLALILRSGAWLTVNILFAAALASLVNSVRAFVSVYFAALFAMLALNIIPLGLRELLSNMTEFIYHRPVAACISLVLLLLLALVLRYRHRRWLAAVVLLPIVPLFFIAAAAVLSHFDRDVDSEPVTGTMAPVDPSKHSGASSGSDDLVNIGYSFALKPPVSQHWASVTRGRAVLTFADGFTIKQYGFNAEAQPHSGILHFSLAQVSNDVFERYASQPATLEIDLEGYWLERNVVELPLRSSAAVATESDRLTIDYIFGDALDISPRRHDDTASTAGRPYDLNVVLLRQWIGQYQYQHRLSGLLVSEGFPSLPFDYNVGRQSGKPPLYLIQPRSQTARVNLKLSQLPWPVEQRDIWLPTARLQLDYGVPVRRLEQSLRVEGFKMSDWSIGLLGDGTMGHLGMAQLPE